MDSSANRPGTSKSDGGWMGSSWGGSASYSFRGWLTKLRGGGEKLALAEPKSVSSLRQKLLNTWNSMKYNDLWVSDSTNEYESYKTVVILGRFYSLCGTEADQNAAFSQLFLDYYSRIWLTYRTSFPRIPSTTVTTDCGWGCMLRTSQMITAQALLLSRLGRDWRARCVSRKRTNDWEEVTGEEAVGSHQVCKREGRSHKDVRNGEKSQDSEEDEEVTSDEDDSSPTNESQRQILQLFEDSEEAPLGLHQLLSLLDGGPKAGIGRWFAPSEALTLIRRALRVSASPLTGDLSCLLSFNGRVLASEAERESVNWTKKLMVFVCLRFGGHTVNECYFPHLKHLLSRPSCLGLVGGKPNHSLYFIGYYDDELVYLDPHVAHPYVRLSAKGEERQRNSLRSFHCALLSKMNIKQIDPSAAVGFFFENKEEFENTMKYFNQHGVIDIEEEAGMGDRCNAEPLFTLVKHLDDQALPDYNHSDQDIEQARLHGFELMG